jgi:hypothetical protein
MSGVAEDQAYVVMVIEIALYNDCLIAMPLTACCLALLCQQRGARPKLALGALDSIGRVLKRATGATAATATRRAAAAAAAATASTSNGAEASAAPKYVCDRGFRSMECQPYIRIATPRGLEMIQDRGRLWYMCKHAGTKGPPLCRVR